MPSYTKYPTANGYYGGWSGMSAASMSDSSDATYMYTGASATYTASYTMEDLPADAATVDSVVVNDRNAFTGDGPNWHWGLFCTSAGTIGSSYVSLAVYDGIAGPAGNASNAIAVAPQGGSWTVANFNASEIGVQSDMGTNDFHYVYELFATGSYTQAGAFLVWIYSLAGPFIGAALTFNNFARICTDYLWTSSRLSHYRLTDSELSTAWREYKDTGIVIPKYCFL